MKPVSRRETFSFQPANYGQSVTGIPLEVWFPVERNHQDILVVAGIHGGEPESTKVLSCALRSLEKEELKCTVVLCANPDGLIRGTRSNRNGVDLNRNFPTTDWHAGSLKVKWMYEGDRCVEIGTGQTAASEPEIKAILSLIFYKQEVLHLHSE